MESETNDNINFLNQYSEIVAKIENKETLDQFLHILTQKFAKLNLKSINSLILNSLCNNICAKILIMSLGQTIDQHIHDFVIFMRDNQIMPPVY